MPPLAARCALLAFAASLAGPAFSQRTPAGTVSVIRQVRSAGPTRGGREFEPVRDGASLRSGEILQTLKRSYASVAFANGGALRLNTRTTVRIEAAGDKNRVTLEAGSLLVQGGATTVDTGTAEVSGKDATFEVRRRPDGTDILVLNGAATVTSGDRKATVPAGSAFTVIVDGPRREFGGSEEVPLHRRTVEMGGSRVGWWAAIDRERGVAVFPGSEAAWALRTSPLTETVTQIASIPLSPSAIANDPADKARLLAIARTGIIPKLEQDLAQDETLSLSGYVERYGFDAVRDRFPVGGDDLAFLLDHGIGNVAQVFEAVGATGSSFGIDVRSRAVYRPSSLEAAPNPTFRFMDGNQRSNAFAAVGMALSAILDRDRLKSVSTQAEGSVFGVTADPQALGARISAEAAVGTSRYQIEGNTTRILSGALSETYGAIDSVLGVDRAIGPGLRVFAGRRRFVSGPVFQNQVRSQLLADRYTGVGATLQRDGTTVEAAYLHDANPDARGAQAGALFSAKRTIAGGSFGVQAIRVPDLRGGFGMTVSGSYPVAPGRIDGYFEAGRAPDASGVYTVGAYLPGLYQQSDIDLFVEFANHKGIGRALSVMASRDFADSATVRVFGHAGTNAFGKTETGGGVALLFRYAAR